MPDDLSVIGFDDIPQAGWDAYRLTTFRQPVGRSDRRRDGRFAVARNARRRTRSTTVPVELVVRSTVRGLVAEAIGMTRPQVVAHRGSSARHADNSWAAFEAAVGKVRMRSNATSRRRATASSSSVTTSRIDDRLVADLTSPRSKARAPGIVGLADLLAFAEQRADRSAGRDQGPRRGRSRGADDWRKRRRDRIVVGSFHGPALAAVKATLPDVQTSFMMGSVAGARRADPARRRISRRWRAPLLGNARSPAASIAGRGAIDRLRRAGLAITLWHEEREDELRAMVAFEPDAICTNTPAVLRRIVDAHAASRTRDRR